MADNMSYLSNMIASQEAAKAADASRAAIQQGQTNSLAALGQGYNTGRADINAATGNAVGAIGQGGATGQGYFDSALSNSKTALGDAYGTATNAINQGYNNANTAINQGINVNQPWLSGGQNANTMYGNALGLNGASGNQAAANAFQAGPGYNWQVGQATDAIARKMGALGMAGSGNAMTAISDRAGQMANQEYGNWQNRLQGLSAQGQQAAGAMQSGYNNLANNANSYGQNMSNLASNYGSNMGNLYSTYGQNSANLANTNATNTANIYSNQGNNLSSLAAGYGQNQANVYTGAANNIANTNMQGAQLANEAFTSGAASMDAQNNASANRRTALVGGLLSGLGTAGAYAAGGPMGGAVANKFIG